MASSPLPLCYLKSSLNSTLPFSPLITQLQPYGPLAVSQTCKDNSQRPFAVPSNWNVLSPQRLTHLLPSGLCANDTTSDISLTISFKNCHFCMFFYHFPLLYFSQQHFLFSDILIFACLFILSLHH